MDRGGIKGNEQGTKCTGIYTIDWPPDRRVAYASERITVPFEAILLVSRMGRFLGLVLTSATAF